MNGQPPPSHEFFCHLSASVGHLRSAGHAINACISSVFHAAACLPWAAFAGTLNLLHIELLWSENHHDLIITMRPFTVPMASLSARLGAVSPPPTLPGLQSISPTLGSPPSSLKVAKRRRRGSRGITPTSVHDLSSGFLSPNAVTPPERAHAQPPLPTSPLALVPRLSPPTAPVPECKRRIFPVSIGDTGSRSPCLLAPLPAANPRAHPGPTPPHDVPSALSTISFTNSSSHQVLTTAPTSSPLPPCTSAQPLAARALRHYWSPLVTLFSYHVVLASLDFMPECWDADPKSF